jgi:hypothetical protein
VFPEHAEKPPACLPRATRSAGLPVHDAQLLAYLRPIGCAMGLLLNFQHQPGERWPCRLIDRPPCSVFWAVREKPRTKHGLLRVLREHRVLRDSCRPPARRDRANVTAGREQPGRRWEASAAANPLMTTGNVKRRTAGSRDNSCNPWLFCILSHLSLESAKHGDRGGAFSGHGSMCEPCVRSEPEKAASGSGYPTALPSGRGASEHTGRRAGGVS